MCYSPCNYIYVPMRNNVQYNSSTTIAQYYTVVCYCLLPCSLQELFVAGTRCLCERANITILAADLLRIVPSEGISAVAPSEDVVSLATSEDVVEMFAYLEDVMEAASLEDVLLQGLYCSLLVKLVLLVRPAPPRAPKKAAERGRGPGSARERKNWNVRRVVAPANVPVIRNYPILSDFFRKLTRAVHRRGIYSCTAIRTAFSPSCHSTMQYF